MNDAADYISEVCRFYVMLVLLAAATGKMRSIRAFQGALESLTGVARSWSRGAALSLIAAEGLVGLLLLIGGETARVGMMAAAALFLGFSGVISLTLARGAALACNCFGNSSHTVSGFDLIRSIGSLAACALYIAQFDGQSAASPIDLIMIFGVATIIAILSIRLPDMAFLSRR